MPQEAFEFSHRPTRRTGELLIEGGPGDVGDSTASGTRRGELDPSGSADNDVEGTRMRPEEFAQ